MTVVGSDVGIEQNNQSRGVKNTGVYKKGSKRSYKEDKFVAYSGHSVWMYLLPTVPCFL